MEEWKWIEGYEGRYKVYRDGRIWSELNERFLKGSRSRGYSTIIFGRRGYIVHRLVAIAFIPNPENKPEVNHKNGIKNDNRVENLEWATTKENHHHARATGLLNYVGEIHHMSKLTAIQVIDIRTKHMNGESLNTLALKYDVSNITIRRIVCGKIWKELPIQEYIPNTKLTLEVMTTIKKMKSEGVSRKDISRKTGINYAEVNRLISGKIFASKYQSINV